jgi:hypothetical protein
MRLGLERADALEAGGYQAAGMNVSAHWETDLSLDASVPFDRNFAVDELARRKEELALLNPQPSKRVGNKPV